MSESDSGAVNIQNSCESGYEQPNSRVKIEKEWSTTPRQRYVGEALHGNLHGPGFYSIDGSEKLFYDGLFYANKLEGYAQVFYNDGSNFQGLFKNNRRFGPGVLTYQNGEQDVGLWIGQKLVRSSSLDPNNLIPRLATTNEGQLKLLKYRNLVTVSLKSTDTAYDILASLGASEDILKRSDELYNAKADNKRNLFLKRKLYNDQFYPDQDFTIDVALTSEELETLENDWVPDTQAVEETVDVNVARMTRIPEQLEVVEDKLKAAQERRAELQEKVDRCRTCCYRATQLEESSPRPAPPGSEEQTPRHSIDLEPHLMRETKTTVVEVDPGTPERRVSDSTTDILISSVFTTEEPRVSATTSSTSAQDASRTSDTTDADVISQIKNYLRDGGGCGEAIFVEDLHELEEKLEGAVRDELFFESIRRSLQEKLDRHAEKSQAMSRARTKKVPVTEVLAWNNEEGCMRMLRHSFIHRKSEYMVNFEVADLIAGNRSNFKGRGARERDCSSFLKACSDGDLAAIHEHARKRDADINACDAKGNTGVFFAVKNSRKEVVRLLANLGADLNRENDEGVTPLTLSVLTALAFKNKVKVWERSFLPAEPTRDQTDSVKWYPNMSPLDVPTQNPRRRVSETKANEHTRYLFDTSFVLPGDQKAIALRDKLAHAHLAPSFEMDIRVIQDTLDALLDYGADPNVGGCPLPPLFLSLFTEDPSMVESLLNSPVDVDAKIGEGLTALHVVASGRCTQSNVRICRLLISHNCDATERTSADHWKAQKVRLLGRNANADAAEDLGKNPLHLLCVRRDFTLDRSSYFFDMVANFRDSPVDFSDTYLGHTALSLAALVGNKKVVDALMTYRLVDPHQVLGNGMGNVLTLYTLRRYEGMIPPNALEILRYLSEEGVNVLNPVGEFENSVAFTLKEREEVVATKRKGASKRKEDAPQAAVVDYLTRLGRETIIKCIQLMAVENLYNMTEEGCLDHGCIPILCEYLTPNLAISNLRCLFNHGKIEPDRFDTDTCGRLVTLVRDSLNAAIEGELAKKKAKTSASHVTLDTSDYSFILNMVDFSRTESDALKFQLLPPGLDSASKYKVCFHCLRGRDRELVVCPRCQLVHFCSAACNRDNLALKLHPCNADFYAAELSRLRSPHAFLEPESWAKLFGRIRDQCDKRRAEKIGREKELKRERLEMQIKSDVYGIKFMGRKHRLDSYESKCHTIRTLPDSSCCSSEVEVRVHFLEELPTHSVLEPPGKGPVENPLPPKKRVDPLERIRSVRKPCSNEKDDCRRTQCAGCKKIKCNCPPDRKTSTLKVKFAVDKEMEDANITVRKLRVVPDRCQDFVKLLKGYIPDLNVSSLLLPYACYSNGHMYYKFLDNKSDRTYSMM